MNSEDYNKLLRYLDGYLWEYKLSETNLRYLGIILDEYFDNSILSVDYLDIDDYFSEIISTDFVDDVRLEEQFLGYNDEKKLKIINAVVNILLKSSKNKVENKKIADRVIKFLKRKNIVIEQITEEELLFKYDFIIDSGSYCEIVYVNENIVRKQLKSIYRDNITYQKRMKYEFDNMFKLIECPKVLNVFEYEEDTHSYLMEKADENIFEFLEEAVDIDLDTKIKISLDLLEGMNTAHKNSIIHRDLHLGNILRLREDFLLCDFGLSKDLSKKLSLKSSMTPKNSHMFMDPIGLVDFTKLDDKSDIYSIGKIIDYIFALNSDKSRHIFSYVVEKCTNRDRDKRYNSVADVIHDVSLKLDELKSIEIKSNVVEEIKNGVFNTRVAEYIDRLILRDSLCDTIVKYQLYNFGQIIMELPFQMQVSVLQTIDSGYAESTGYRGWSNYDIYASISYHICLNTEEENVFKIAYSILEECSSIRFQAKDYLDKIDAMRD